MRVDLYDLHSTMYLLNPRYEKVNMKSVTNLHSTMYLLNPNGISLYDLALLVYLHSTMYLLNHPVPLRHLLVFPIYIPLCIY